MTKQELIALGLTEENAEKVLKEHIPYERFKQVNDKKKTLEGQLKAAICILIIITFFINTFFPIT